MLAGVLYRNTNARRVSADLFSACSEEREMNDLSRWQQITLAVIVAALVANLCGIAYRNRPVRMPDNHQQLARYAAECFEHGGETYSIKEGCK